MKINYVPVVIELAGPSILRGSAVSLGDGPRRKTPGRQIICSNGSHWLSSGEMRSPFVAFSPPNERRCGLFC